MPYTKRIPDYVKKAIDAEDDEALADWFESDDFNPDPDDWVDAAPLRAIVEARHGVDDARAELDRAVAAAHTAGFSWGLIGLMLDISRQAARQRFGHLVA